MKHTKRCQGRVERARIIMTAPDVGLAMAWRTCATCGTWLPLGPSDETPVAVEVRAAKMAADVAYDPRRRERLNRGTEGGREAWGWYARLTGHWPRDEDAQHTGYLAHAIAHHDEEQADTSLPAELLPDAIALSMRAPRIR